MSVRKVFFNYDYVSFWLMSVKSIFANFGQSSFWLTSILAIIDQHEMIFVDFSRRGFQQIPTSNFHRLSMEQFLIYSVGCFSPSSTMAVFGRRRPRLFLSMSTGEVLSWSIRTILSCCQLEQFRQLWPRWLSTGFGLGYFVIIHESFLLALNGVMFANFKIMVGFGRHWSGQFSSSSVGAIFS